MKKITIGSLKHQNMQSAASLNQSIHMNKQPVYILNRVVEMKQNQRYFRVEVKKGQSILDAALEQNVHLDYKCKKGTCGKCKVELLRGSTYLQPVNHLEEKKLQGLIQRGFRLACQSIVK